MAAAALMGRLMRALGTILAACLFGVVSATGVVAGYAESEAWFAGLTHDQRNDIQGDLILLGYYDQLVDGAFGEGLFTSLVSLQQNQGREPTGVLSDSELSRLGAEADLVVERFGLQAVSDERAKLSLVIPSALIRAKSASDQGTFYTSNDDGLWLETTRRPLELQPFNELFAALTRTVTGRIVNYSHLDEDRFVITGAEKGRRFYTLFSKTGVESVGYSLSWQPGYDRDATILAAYLGSNARPLEATLSTGEPRTTSATAIRKFGVFQLPEAAPEAIQLSGEIGIDSPAHFKRALDARPDATVLVLNSPGGYVDKALAIADEVHKRGMTTVVRSGQGCYSACAYIFFAGAPRQAYGQLGVHQIHTGIDDLVYAQTTLSNVLDALYLYGVEQSIISHMLRTPPDDMYVFTSTEMSDWHINRGDPVRLAGLKVEPPAAIVPADQVISASIVNLGR